MNRQEVLRIELAQKRLAHRDLNDSIDALHLSVNPDLLTLQRLKRNKLAIKDEIKRLEDAITPDIIA
ncbi:hypothetical protein GCM10007939_23380 [Amylibacter marinus]|uniref:DUF465 domain-containing protein n=2 Tax=Amylibacter marinus TaxID=1475483 RepID=A0ABQ5VXP1_9RHOB|nr:hypothetical protein GCM10007939_23380 [Amylibacter marinus]